MADSVNRAVQNVAASSTDANLVSAVSGFKIKVVAVYGKTGGTATNVTFNSKGSGSGTAISPLIATAINGEVNMQYNPTGWFATNSSEGLTVTTGSGSTVGLMVVYTLDT